MLSSLRVGLLAPPDGPSESCPDTLPPAIPKAGVERAGLGVNLMFGHEKPPEAPGRLPIDGTIEPQISYVGEAATLCVRVPHSPRTSAHPDSSLETKPSWIFKQTTRLSGANL